MIHDHVRRKQGHIDKFTCINCHLRITADTLTAANILFLFTEARHVNSLIRYPRCNAIMHTNSNIPEKLELLPDPDPDDATEATDE